MGYWGERKLTKTVCTGTEVLIVKETNWEENKDDPVRTWGIWIHGNPVCQREDKEDERREGNNA